MEKGMLKKMKIVGLPFTVTNKYHTEENLRSLQSSLIALSTQNNYYAILAYSCHII